MTDAEKELRQIAQDCEDRRDTGYWTADLHHLHSKLWPKNVLALLDRIEALEKKVGEAERKGAEKAAALVASLPERLGHKQVPYRAAIIDAETWIRTTLVDAP